MVLPRHSGWLGFNLVSRSTAAAVSANKRAIGKHVACVPRLFKKHANDAAPFKLRVVVNKESPHMVDGTVDRPPFRPDSKYNHPPFDMMPDLLCELHRVYHLEILPLPEFARCINAYVLFDLLRERG